MNYLISLIIPSHRNRKGLLRLLLSIKNQQFSPDLFEILVVFNPPDQSFVKYLEHLDFTCRIILIQSYLVSSNHARNLGIEKAAGRILLFLDDDCELTDPLFLSKHLEFHHNNPLIAAAGGPYCLNSQSNFLIKHYHLIQTTWLQSGRKGRNSIQYLLGGNCSFKRAAIKKNLFDPKIIFGGSETELFLRMGAQGYEFRLLEDLAITHYSDVNLLRLIRKCFAQGLGTEYALNKGLKPIHYIHYPSNSQIQISPSWLSFLTTTAHKAGCKYYRNKKRLKASTNEIFFRVFIEGILHFRIVHFFPFLESLFLCLKAALKVDF